MKGDITLSRKYNRNTYRKFSQMNKVVRESSLAPSAFSKIEDKGVAGKVAASIGEKLIEAPLHKTTRKAVGKVYNKRKHKPYVGSVLYTIFKWGGLAILAIFSPMAMVAVVIGGLWKVGKIFK
jgi:hypothetical protein